MVGFVKIEPMTCLVCQKEVLVKRDIDTNEPVYGFVLPLGYCQHPPECEEALLRYVQRTKPQAAEPTPLPNP